MRDVHSAGRNGFLVVERKLIPDAVPPRTPIDIARPYRGIMGQPWPEEGAIVAILGGEERLLSDGFASLADYDAVRNYYVRVSSTYICDFLYCDILTAWYAPRPVSLPSSFAFYGYDYGYYLGAYCSFSAIYNDVLHGRHAVLRAFGAKLNGYRLLPSLDVAQQLDHMRQRLIAEHASLEADEDFGPIAVYGYQG